MTVPIFIIDAQEQLAYYNEAAETLLGRPFGETGLELEQLARWLRLQTEDGSPLSPGESPMMLVVRQRQPIHLRLRLRGMDGAWNLVDATALPLEGYGGQPLGTLAFFWPLEEV